MTEKNTAKRFSEKDYIDEISQINTEIRNFKESGDKADGSFLKVGELLVQAKKEKQLTDKHFAKLKKVAAGLLGKNSIRNISKVVAIAQCDAIQRNKDKLPKSWTTLAVLASAPNVAELIKTKKVTVTSSRSDISKLAKGTKNATPKWVYVELASDNKHYTEQQVEVLKKLLNGSDWVVKSKKVETDKEVSTKTTKTKK